PIDFADSIMSDILAPSCRALIAREAAPEILAHKSMDSLGTGFWADAGAPAKSIANAVAKTNALTMHPPFLSVSGILSPSIQAQYSAIACRLVDMLDKFAYLLAVEDFTGQVDGDCGVLG